VIPAGRSAVVMKRDERGRFRKERGYHLDSKGYFRYSAGPNRNKRVHRVMMEERLGRPLKKNEVVNHRDGNKQNNGLHWDGQSNLELMDVEKHNAVSAKQYWFLKTNVWPKEQQEWAEYFGVSVESLAPDAYAAWGGADSEPY
jgi:hypothetical protein